MEDDFADVRKMGFPGAFSVARSLQVVSSIDLWKGNLLSKGVCIFS